jgi:SAM-dependent methyltransferase
MTGDKNGGARQARDVAAHYARWPFPGGDHGGREGFLLLRRLAGWCGTKSAEGHRPTVLDAGCGTGHTTVALARRLPGVDLLGVDVSSASIEIARALADRSNVPNVRFEVGDITRDLAPDLSCRAVLSFGVLHHVPDREEAMMALAAALETGGHLALWLYGVHGRRAHALHQRFVRLLAGPEPTDSDLARVSRAFVDALGDEYLPGSGVYTPTEAHGSPARWLALHPQWLADQMFPAYERPVDLSSILSLLDDHGLAFEEWLGVPEEASRWTAEPILVERLDSLPRLDRLQAIECLLKPAYYFVTAGKPGRGV